MAAQERLTVEQIRTADLLSAHHLHRYEWAAALCGGRRVVDLACGVGYGSDLLARAATSVLGVDRDEEAVLAARRHFESEHVRFEQSDAAAFLRRSVEVDADVLVCFEGLEHFDDLPEVLDLLRALALRGLKLLLSFPNEDKFLEENHFHVQTFGHRDVRELARTLPDAQVLQQFLAEGSLIGPVNGEAPERAAALVVASERLEPDYANHWLIAVGFDERELAEASAHLNIATAPNYNSYMRALERANQELHRLNLELQQEQLGVRDAAAAGRAQKVAGLADRYEELLERYSAPRYRAMDNVRERLLRAPGVSVAWWNLRRGVRFARRTRGSLGRAAEHTS